MSSFFFSISTSSEIESSKKPTYKAPEDTQGGLYVSFYDYFAPQKVDFNWSELARTY